MDSTALIGFISIGLMVFLQIILFGYGYGKLSQKVNDVCKSQEDLRNEVRTIKKETASLASKVAVLESREK